MMTGSPSAFSLTEAALSTQHCPNNAIYNVLKSYSIASSVISGPASIWVPNECRFPVRLFKSTNNGPSENFTIISAIESQQQIQFLFPVLQWHICCVTIRDYHPECLCLQKSIKMKSVKGFYALVPYKLHWLLKTPVTTNKSNLSYPAIVSQGSQPFRVGSLLQLILTSRAEDSKSCLIRISTSS